MVASDKNNCYMIINSSRSIVKVGLMTMLVVPAAIMPPAQQCAIIFAVPLMSDHYCF